MKTEIAFLENILYCLLRHSQITFDNKSVIFENKIERFNKITSRIEKRIKLWKSLEVKNDKKN